MILSFSPSPPFVLQFFFTKPLFRLLLLWSQKKTHCIKEQKLFILNIISIALAAIITTATSFIITSNMITPAAGTTIANNTTTTSLPSGIE
jgi:hypothetical protein